MLEDLDFFANAASSPLFACASSTSMRARRHLNSFPVASEDLLPPPLCNSTPLPQFLYPLCIDGCSLKRSGRRAPLHIFIEKLQVGRVPCCSRDDSRLPLPPDLANVKRFSASPLVLVRESHRLGHAMYDYKSSYFYTSYTECICR